VRFITNKKQQFQKHSSFEKIILFDLLILLILSLFIVHNFFKDNRPIWFYDHFWPVLGDTYFKSNLFAWNSDGIGMSFVRGIPNLLPMGLFIGISSYLGIDLVLSQKVYYLFIIFGAASSMYFFSWVMGLERWGRLFSSMFYGFGLSLILGFSYLTLFAFLPLTTGLYIYGLIKNRRYLYIFLFCILWTVIATSAYSNPGYILLQWFPVIFFGFYYFINEKGKRRYVLKYTLMVVLLWSIINSFWIIPNLFSIDTNLESSKIGGISDISVMKGSSADLQWALVGLPYSANYLLTFKGVDMIFPWAAHFFKPVTIIIEFFFLVLMLSFLFFRGDKQYRLFLYILLGFLFFVMIETGLKQPFEAINLIIFSKIPLFTTIFRNLTKFNLIVQLFAALLMGKSIDQLYNKVKNYRVLSVMFLIILFGTFFYYSLPVWQGYRFVEDGQYLRSSSVELPGYYEEANRLFNQDQRNNRILPFPLTKTYQTAFKWNHGYQGSNPYPYIFDKTTIGNMWGFEDIIATVSDNVQLVEQSSTIYEINEQIGEFSYFVPAYSFNNKSFEDMVDYQGSGINSEPVSKNWSYTSGQMISEKPAYLIWNFTTYYPITNVYIKYRSFNHPDYGEKLSVSRDGETWHEIIDNNLDDKKQSYKEAFTDVLNNATYFYLKLENNTRKHPTINYLEVRAYLDTSNRDLKSEYLTKRNEERHAGNTSLNNITDYLFKILNIEYLMLHLDTNWDYIEGRDNDWYPISEFKYKAFFNRLQTKYRSHDIGRLNLIALDNPERYIYLSSNLAYLNLSNSEFLRSIDNFKVAPESWQLVVDPGDIEKDYSNQISYKTINPTQYTINITKLDPKYLIFSTRYDKYWILTEGKPSFIARLFSKPNQNHFKVNIYANGWLVEKPGEYTLFYYPQQVMYASLIIMLVIASGIAMILIYRKKGKVA
jgi:hypothetical protein